LALVVGCGGGSGDDSIPAGALEGEYDVVEFGLDPDYDHPRAENMRMRFGSGGNMERKNDAGDFVPADTFSVHGDLTVDLGANATGVLGTNADIMAVGALVAGEDLSVRLALRSTTWADASSINGWYVLCFIRTTAATGECSTALWAAQARDSVMEWTVISDSDGAAGSVGIWPYAASHGVFTMERYIGALKPDGSLFVASRKNVGGSSVVIGVRRDLDVRNRLLGKYVGYSFAAQGLTCTTSRFTLDADGQSAARNGTWSDGAPDSETFTYELSPEGYLLVGGKHFGALMDHGNFFVGVDTDASDGTVGLHMGVRNGD
jgi:hypothetical protein